MSMDHHYDFFDRDFFDPLWGLSWQEFIRRHRSRWVSKKDYFPGQYSGEGLRELISFCIDPEPSREVVEAILARRTVRWTAQHSTPHFYFLSEVIGNVPRSRPHRAYSGEINDASVFIGSATTRYLEGKMPAETLRAILKLHSAEPAEWMELTRRQKRAVAPIVSSIEWLKTIYPWQGREVIAAEDANCLDVSDTRRFAHFIVDAWRENWPVGPVKRHGGEPRIDRFRDYYGSDPMRDAARKALRFARPSVFRVWY